MNYQKIYDAIIEKARLRDKFEGYYEKHHIIPRSLGGLDTQENLVKLIFKEHFICHRLLTRIYSNEVKMHYAF
jgi:5-methylcytosine-specific restriction endonuclease McrA